MIHLGGKLKPFSKNLDKWKETISFPKFDKILIAFDSVHTKF